MTTHPDTSTAADPDVDELQAGERAGGDGSVLPDWAEQDPVVCVDGPMAGHWYTAQDWATRQASAHAMAERGQRPVPASAYVPTGRHVTHPNAAGVTGTALTYEPAGHALTEASRDHQDEPTAATSAPTDLDRGAGGVRGGVRVLVTGSRTWTGYREIADALEAVREQLPAGAQLTIVHGACPTGADALADLWARRHADQGVWVERHPADWATHQRAAGPIRNTAMVAAGADLCLAFIQDASTGATHAAQTARAAGIATRQHERATRTRDHGDQADQVADLPEPADGVMAAVGAGDVDEPGWW